MLSRIERSVISALCMGVLFCLAAAITPAQTCPTGNCPNIPTQAIQTVPQQPCPTGNCPAQVIQTVPAPTAQQTCPSGNCPAQTCPSGNCPTQTCPAQVTQVVMAPRCPTAPCLNDCDKVKDAGKASAEAAEVFRKIAVLRDRVPQDILCKAVAIGAFDGVFNAAFGIGYRQGDGAITIRTPNGWSAPVFYKMRGGSFGWQLGATSTDYLLIFMSQDSIRDMADGEFDLQTNANAVAGPVFGAKGTISYHAFPKDKTVFAYARTKGLFAGVMIDGARLSPRNSLNQEVYGADAEALMSNPARLQTVATSCLAPGLCDLPTTVAANAPNPVTPVVFVQPQPQPQATAPTAEAAPAPAPQPAPKPVVEVKEEEVIIEEQPQPQPTRATPRRRAHKMKS